MTPHLWFGSRHRFVCRIAPLILAILPMPAPAQSVPVDAATAVDHYLGAQMSRLRIPGLAVAVVKEGRIVLARSYGIGSVEFGLPVRDDTVFAINSITKAFTGVAAMRLVDKGKLDLSAPVGRYLKDLPEAWRGVTIRQLLSHQSGLPDVMRAPTVETDAAVAWTWVQQQPVRFAPGDHFNYCQTNYTLVQRVLNKIEGRALDAPLAGEQLQLAAMAHTSYGDAYDMIPNKVPTYRWSLPGPFVNGYSAAAPDTPRQMQETSERFLPFRRASSGLNSTAIDMAQWLIALEKGSLLTAPARETMWQPLAFTDGTPGQWGMGWEILARGSHRAVGMTGGGRAAVFYYPEDHVGVVILTNLTGAFPEDMVDKIASLYAPDLPLTGVPALRIRLEEEGYEHAAAAAAAIKAGNPGLVWSEDELNDWGYRLLSNGRAQDAVPLFAFIAAEFPKSVNAHDSLAQAYHVVGERAASAQEYRRVLELDPANAAAKRHLAELVGA
ncbi:serine hydrolase [Novosphingobium sp.]|uniref:serine hydrolase n=1 Tax=Novosphingobium sp. TaxID=1874826 RepID=UPI0031E201C8